MNEASAAKALSALGHEARLRIFRLLVRAGEKGLNIGDIGRLVGLPASTLNHHLGTLVEAGLVVQHKEGREVLNRVAYAEVSAVLRFVESECCAGVDLSHGDAA